MMTFEKYVRLVDGLEAVAEYLEYEGKTCWVNDKNGRRSIKTELRNIKKEYDLYEMDRQDEMRMEREGDEYDEYNN